jgi:hypothetical protein
LSIYYRAVSVKGPARRVLGNKLRFAFAPHLRYNRATT